MSGCVGIFFSHAEHLNVYVASVLFVPKGRVDMILLLVGFHDDCVFLCTGMRAFYILGSTCMSKVREKSQRKKVQGVESGFKSLGKGYFDRV